MRDIDRLLQDCIADMGALETLYRLFKQDVFAYSFSILRDCTLSEECVQETFIRLPRAAGAAGEIRSGKAFVLSVARNIALELLRKNKKYVLVETVEDTAAAPDMTDEIEVLQMLEGLDDDQRQIVVMHVFSDLTFKDIARLLAMTVSTVKYKYGRAKTTMKSRMEAAYNA